MTQLRPSNMFISEVIDAIDQTQGKLAKQALLAQAMKETPNFVDFVKSVFHPIHRYGIRKIPEYKPNMQGGDYGIRRVFEKDMLKPLYTRKVTGGKAEQYLLAILENLDYRDAKAIEMIIARNIDCGVSVNSINKCQPDTIKTFPVMLCCPYNEKAALNFVYPAISQIKADGLRGNIVVRDGVVTTFSRNGKDLGLDVHFGFVGEKFPTKNFVLDGEVLVRHPSGEGYLPRKESNGIINRCAQGTATDEQMAQVVFVAWDIIQITNFDEAVQWDEPTVDRLRTLTEFVDALGSPSIEVIETRIVNSHVDAMNHFADAIDRELEGTILKNMKAPWVPGRPKTQLKLKLGDISYGDGKYMRECDLEIVGMKEGNRKYKGMMGALHYASRDRKVNVSVGGGWTDKERAEIFEKFETDYKGKIGTVRYNEKISSGTGENIRWSLFLPRIVEAVRIDKDEADSFDEIK